MAPLICIWLHWSEPLARGGELPRAPSWRWAKTMLDFIQDRNLISWTPSKTILPVWEAKRSSRLLHFRYSCAECYRENRANKKKVITSVYKLMSYWRAGGGTKHLILPRASNTLATAQSLTFNGSGLQFCRSATRCILTTCLLMTTVKTWGTTES